MKLTIIGNGSFGSFLKELLADKFELCESAESVVLAVPFLAYNEMGLEYGDRKHLINVCSVQEPSTNALMAHTDEVTSIHPLFGRRTPADKRYSILTWRCGHPNEQKFLDIFETVSPIVTETGKKDVGGKPILFNPTTHDQLMAKTHVAALLAAEQMKIYVDRAKDIPDEFIPNSFRLLREFVKTMEDMPSGTVQSILANPYF